MKKYAHFARALWIVSTFAMSLLCSCGPPPSQGSAGLSSSAVTETRGERRPASAPRDLSEDEAAGGHVLRKHVGRTDDELRERLERERNISGSSTYTDRATAEQAIGNAIAENRDRIQRWLSRPGRHTNLVLDYDAPSPIGRTFNRGDNQSRPCSHALVVLKFDSPGSYHVLTSYPECRS
jgi:hypothetical protein